MVGTVGADGDPEADVGTSVERSDQHGQWEDVPDVRQCHAWCELRGMRLLIINCESSIVMAIPRELMNFLLLDHSQQVEAIWRLHSTGWSDHTIAAATRLSVEMIRRILAEHLHHTEAQA